MPKFNVTLHYNVRRHGDLMIEAESMADAVAKVGKLSERTLYLESEDCSGMTELADSVDMVADIDEILPDGAHGAGTQFVEDFPARDEIKFCDIRTRPR